MSAVYQRADTEGNILMVDAAWSREVVEIGGRRGQGISMNELSRREFLHRAAAIAAGATVAGPSPALAAMMGGGVGGGGGGGGTGGSTSLIDPPVGGVFADPPVLADLSPDPSVVEVLLDAKRASVNVNGTAAQLLTYNGQAPAGTIRVRRDQLLRIRFKNSLPTDGATNILGHPKWVTNLHTHGLHVNPGDNPNGTHADNMLVMLMPGEQTVYEYDLTKHRPGNLNFYHPHIHGSVAEQVWGGMAGALVVEDEMPVLSGLETHIMVLKDINLVGGAPEPHDSTMDYTHGLEGNTVMVNGKVNPRLYTAPGQVQRWRIVNASISRFYRLSLASHTMYLAGTEGGLLDKPYPITELLLSPGERADILVKADKSSSSYKFLSLPYSRIGMMGGQQITLFTLTYKGTRRTDAIPAVLDPMAMRMDMDTSMMPVVTMDLSMGQGRGYINGLTFTDHEHCYSHHSMLGHHEVWEVTNSSGMDHPFHQHVNHVQVLSITGGDAKYANLWTTTPAWKDTVIVPKWGKVRLLVPAEDYAGHAMFHCHILGHEDIGMMGMWHLMEDMGGGMGM